MGGKDRWGLKKISAEKLDGGLIKQLSSILWSPSQIMSHYPDSDRGHPGRLVSFAASCGSVMSTIY